MRPHFSRPHFDRAKWIALDQRWTLRFNQASHNHFWCAFFATLSRLGNGVFWYSLMVALLAFYGRSAVKGVVHMVVVGVIGLLLYKWLKRLTSRPRPFMRSAAIHRATTVLDEYSFPSGHTLHACSFTVIALAYFPFLAPLLIPFTLLVAASRPVLGLHYPSDVLAGAVLGSGLALATLFLV